jgi:hypothetical protein
MIVEKHEATVMSVEDPEKRGRIKIACAGLLGDEDTELPDWIEPNLDWGWFVIPDVGEIIEVETIAGNDQDEVFGQSSIENMEIRYTGKRSWTDDVVDSSNEARPVNEEFKTNYGKRRGFATPNGHMIFFDDTSDGQKINITWHQDGKYQYIAMDEKGSMTIANANGSMIYLDAENGAATLVDEHGNHYSSDANGLKVVDKNGNFIEMKDGVIQIVSQGNVVAMGSDATLKTATVNLLDGATDRVVKGDTFMTTCFDIHTHATAFGPSGPPLPLMSTLQATVLSANCKVGS